MISLPSYFESRQRRDPLPSRPPTSPTAERPARRHGRFNRDAQATTAGTEARPLQPRCPGDDGRHRGTAASTAMPRRRRPAQRHGRFNRDAQATTAGTEARPLQPRCPGDDGRHGGTAVSRAGTSPAPRPRRGQRYRSRHRGPHPRPPQRRGSLKGGDEPRPYITPHAPTRMRDTSVRDAGYHWLQS